MEFTTQHRRSRLEAPGRMVRPEEQEGKNHIEVMEEAFDFVGSDSRYGPGANSLGTINLC